MSRANAKNRIKKDIISCSIEESLKRDLEEAMRQTGASKAEINRRALKQYMSTGQNQAKVMINAVMLLQTINDLKEVIPQEEFDEMQKYMGNIMLIMGGKDNGSF